MKLLAAGDATTSTLVHLIKKNCRVQFSMAWATVNNPVYNAVLANQEKLDKATLGICGYATDPKCLFDFTDCPTLKFAIQKNGLFHPKIYLFETDSTWDVIMGSANMTTGGLKQNSEVMVHLSGVSNEDAFLKDVKKRLNDYFESAIVMDAVTAEKYAALHKLFKKKNPPSIAAPDDDASKHPIKSNVMSMSWEEFTARVKQDPYHGYKERLTLLKQIRRLFRDQPSFKKMNLSARKVIAGLPNDDYPNWGWFGSMKGSGYFHQYVNENRKSLSDALDAIPLKRAVTKDDYDIFIKRYTSTFVDGRDGIGTASRLLSMKRPDQFVCLSSANKKNLSQDFGISSKIDYESYWFEVVHRIQQSLWWNEDKPDTGTEKSIWRSRAALLDTIYYET